MPFFSRMHCFRSRGPARLDSRGLAVVPPRLGGAVRAAFPDGFNPAVAARDATRSGGRRASGASLWRARPVLQRAVLLTILLLVPALPVLAAPSMKILGHGLYGENSIPVTGKCAGVPAKRLADAATVEARLLTRFGLEVVVEGLPDGAPARLDVTLSHPKLTKPGLAEPLASRDWEVPACAGAPVLVAWTLLNEWELAPGDWTFTISHKKQRLASKTFTVKPPATAEPELQLRYQLGNATAAPSGDASAASPDGGDSPALAASALATLRHLEPRQAALVRHAGEARALAQSLRLAGAPATTQPRLLPVGVWQTVLMWDFTVPGLVPPESDNATGATGATGAASPRRPAATGTLAVQLASFKDAGEALAMVDSLAKLGVAAYVESLRGQGRDWHTVRIGPFDDTRSGRDQAALAMNKARARGATFPLLTMSPEPLPHAPTPPRNATLPRDQAAQPLAADAPPSRQPSLLTPGPLLPGMDAAKGAVEKLAKLTLPDQALPDPKDKDTDKETDEEDALAAAQAPPSPRREPPPPPLEQLAATGHLGGGKAVTLQLGPFKKRDDAEALAALAKSGNATLPPGAAIAVTALDNQLFSLRIEGFPTPQAAQAAGEALLAQGGERFAGLSPLVLKGETKKAQRPPAQAANATANATAAPAKVWTVQLHSTAVEEEARRQLETLKAAGLDARLETRQGALGRFFVIRQGRYKDMAAAQKAAQAFAKTHGVPAMVVEETAGP